METWKISHLVRWVTICLDRKSGGLGVKDLGRLNKALLSNCSWRFTNERGALWNDLIRGKFGKHEGDWCSEEEVRGGYGLGCGR